MNSKTVLGIAATLLGIVLATPVALAFDFTPQAGTWAIDEEDNGEPGRGFQIDVQNDILVLYFYGYESTGESTYWLAAGKFEKGSNELTMDLGAYEGGMAFGDPFKDATYLGPQGQVTIRFEGNSFGEICLPDEPCKAISAFNFGYPRNGEALLGSWLLHMQFIRDGATEALESIEFDFLETATTPAAGPAGVVTGDAVIARDGIISVGDLSCERQFGADAWPFKCSIIGLVDLYEEWDFLLAPQRNGVYGEFYDATTGAFLGQLYGIRLQSSTGRFGIPN